MRQAVTLPGSHSLSRAAIQLWMCGPPLTVTADVTGSMSVSQLHTACVLQRYTEDHVQTAKHPPQGELSHGMPLSASTISNAGPECISALHHA
jgi:hypothetical protein